MDALAYLATVGLAAIGAATMLALDLWREIVRLAPILAALALVYVGAIPAAAAYCSVRNRIAARRSI